MNTEKLMLAIVIVAAAIGLVAAATLPSILVPDQALAKEKHGNSFKKCHSFGPGHSDDACFK